MENYNVKYGCGCVHEIEEQSGNHRPTGKQEKCNKHK